MQYVIYARKSTDTEDKQVMSLGSQVNELNKIAERDGLKIVETITESMSAKSPGRPEFNRMIKLVHSGKIDGILCWKLDRLARNFIDGGMIIDSLQRGVIKQITTFESVHNPQENVLLLAVHFGMSTQFSRDLSVNVKRGNREKLNRGDWPNHAPFGYRNDKATKKIVIDIKQAKYVDRAFNLYATGSYSVKDIVEILYSEGLRTNSGKKVLKSSIDRVLKRKFYYGVMERDRELYKGNHKAIISKQLFDKCEDVRNQVLRPKAKSLYFTFRGLIKCHECGCQYTASRKKNKYDYYYSALMVKVFARSQRII